MKSHFTFTKKQRNGIFLLLLLIAVLQCVYFLANFSREEIKIDKQVLETFNKEMDSLRRIELNEKKPKLFPFNPNYITDYKGATLGMSPLEIDRLLAYRKQGKWINSVKEFQNITLVSDSLLNTISPYFKFPEWVSNLPRKQKSINSLKTNKSSNQKIDLNKATALQLQNVNGIGKVLSERIIRFRNTFVGGFIADVQLNDVYGLTPELIDRIKKEFTVKTPRKIEKININTADINELVTIQHIDYNLAAKIIEERVLRGGFKTISELKKVKDFPINKIDIIELYLSLKKNKLL